MRAAILTASQCVTYDEAKSHVKAVFGWGGDEFRTHLLASMLGGLVTTTVTSPVDVIKTKMFVAGRQGSGPLSTFAHLVRTEGYAALFKGWSANYSRLGPQTSITFVVAEQLRHHMGMTTL